MYERLTKPKYEHKRKMAQDTTTPAKKKRGGARKMPTWQEKLASAEPVAVRAWCDSIICSCSYDCGTKLQQLGEDAVQVIANLRASRLAGENLDDVHETYPQKNFSHHPG